MMAGLLIKILPLLVLSLLTACVTYKVEVSPDSNFDAAVNGIVSMDELDRRLSVEKQLTVATTLAAAQTEAVFCTEPLITVLTVGIVPRVCVDTYSATLLLSENDSELVRNYKIRSINGWLALLLLPARNWKYGRAEDWSNVIRHEVVNSPK